MDSVIIYMKTYIYGLVDPSDNRIRYIGKSNNPQKRLYEHHQIKRLKTHTHKNNWIKSLLKLNLKCKIVVLEECDESNWQEREKFYIKKYKNQLTNTTDGGQGEFRKTWNFDYSEETRKQISNSIKKLHAEGVYKIDHEERARKIQGRGEGHKQKYSKYSGVCKSQGKWYAYIRFKKRINLGAYDTELDAACAYDIAAIKYYGGNAKLNRPDLLGKIIPVGSRDKTSSKYKGVSKSVTAGKWTSCIFLNGERIHLGTFGSEQEAYISRLNFEITARLDGYRVGK